MHPRYPAPIADALWSSQARAERLRFISDQYTMDAIERRLMGSISSEDVVSMCETVRGAGPVSVRCWKDAEQRHGHEIVGFLDAYLDRLPPGLHRYVHYGLTSSDLVEYDLHRAISHHAERLLVELGLFVFQINRKKFKYEHLNRAGRTHGQTAEVTTLGHQWGVFADTLHRLRNRINIYQLNSFTKTPGPVGNSPIRFPLLQMVNSTQIIPRDLLMEWANDYLRLALTLESIAMFIRLGARSEIGEFQEGAAANRQGSSAMPGKRNPIDSEKVCGLARIARGYHLALSEVQGSMWEERDLSNSSTERIAVPGLAATVEHMLATMLQVVQNLRVDTERIRANANDPATRANYRQNELQRINGIGPIEASRLATEMEQNQ